MNVGYNPAQQVYLRQKTSLNQSQNEQNRQKMGFGALNIVQLEKAMEQKAKGSFYKLLAYINTRSSVGNVAQAIQIVNKEALAVKKSQYPPIAIEDNYFQSLVQEFNLILKQAGRNYGREVVYNKKEGILAFKTDKKIPPPINVEIKHAAVGKNNSGESGHYDFYFANIMGPEGNLHDKLIKSPTIAKIEQLKAEKHKGFIVGGYNYFMNRKSVFCPHLDNTPMPADEYFNNLLMGFASSCKRVEVLTGNFINHMKSVREQAKNTEEISHLSK